MPVTEEVVRYALGKLGKPGFWPRQCRVVDRRGSDALESAAQSAAFQLTGRARGVPPAADPPTSKSRLLRHQSPKEEITMRLAFRLLLLLVALLSSRALALANTDLERFQGRVRKSAPSETVVTPPVVCVCKDGGPHNNLAGQLFQSAVSAGSPGFEFVRLTCFLPEFQNGAFFTVSACDTWELLPK